MKILLLYPKCPDTFWSFRYALKFIRKKATTPPLGLLTVAAMLPRDWSLRLRDLNVEKFRDSDLKWADYVFLSAMSVQRASADDVIGKCRAHGVKVVAGGPHFTSEHADYLGVVDHLVLDEAEVTLPRFLKDLGRGKPRGLYRAGRRADLTMTPIPLWRLVKMKKYVSMNIQYSRGCPYNCEFCNITVLYGRVPRTKGGAQMAAELESLYQHGWRDGVFLVDDNFIGNRRKLKREVLPAIIGWNELRGHPFAYSTEASINLADDDALMDLMVTAGFDTVFVGIETPHEESLAECNKHHNKGRDMIPCIKKMQQHGLQVQGGFIVGFDSDPPAIFKKLINFIQESGIATAMVGLLNAPRGTQLFKRLTEEGRLLSSVTGDNTDFSMNFIPRMDREVLLRGYREIVDNIYSPRQYYARVMDFLRRYRPLQKKPVRISCNDVYALLRSIILLGIIGRERYHYWKLFFWSLFTRPKLFPLAITLTIYGFHFRKTFGA